MINLYLRQSDITYSRRFVETLMDAGFILTRRNRFKRSGIVLNHGNGEPISVADNVRRLYVINKPSYIYKCSNKLTNYNILPDYYPYTTSNWRDVDDFPIIAKPFSGHHGYGMKVLHDFDELYNFVRRHPSRYLYQKLIPIRHEYRFNVFDGEVYQVSRKERIDEINSQGSDFKYNSIGMGANISDRFWDYVNEIIEDFDSNVGSALGHYGIDIIKGTNKKYYMCEMNTACGLGEYTVDKLLEVLNKKFDNGNLEKYRVR